MQAMIVVDAPPDPALPLPLSQSAAYANALRAMGQPVWQATTRGGHALIARTFGLAATIRGPFWTDPDDTGARSATLRALGLRMIEADGDTAALKHAGFACVVTAAHVAEWHLGTDTALRRAALHGKWRNALVRSGSAGLRTVEGPFDPVPGHWLLRGARQVATTRKYRMFPTAFVQSFVAANPGAARLWAAYDGKDPVAGIVVLRHGPVATYHMGWTNEAGRAANAHHLLMWRAACWLADHGTRRLDLGTLDTESTAGIARFKLGTGAVARALGGSWLRLPGLACVLASRHG